MRKNPLNGHIDAVDANCLTFNKMCEFLQLESRKISRENIHINQHPEFYFQGKDIVYSYIPDNYLENEDIKISVCTYDELFMNVMFDLQNIAALVYYAKGLSVESIDDANTDVLSENFIRQVCGELSQIKLLDEYCYPEILSRAFTYLNLIHLESSESLQPSIKMQIIDDVTCLYDNLDDIYNRYLDRM